MAGTPSLPHAGATTIVVTLPGEIDMTNADRVSADLNAAFALGVGELDTASAAALLFLGTQTAVQKLTGGRSFPPLTWSCPACGQQVTDRAPTGRPAHIEHGHASGCARLSRDQAIDAETRRARLPHLIGQS